MCELDTVIVKNIYITNSENRLSEEQKYYVYRYTYNYEEGKKWRQNFVNGFH